MTIHSSTSRRRPLVAALIALTVTAGCGSSGADGGEPSGGPASASETPTAQTPTAQAPSPSAELPPIVGTWSTTELEPADFDRALSRQGLGKHSAAFTTSADLGKSVDLTLEVGERFWTLFTGTDGASAAMADRATYEMEGKRVVVRPNAGGKNVYRWKLVGDQLILTFESSTEPPYEGVPGEVFQRAYYTTSAFTRTDP